MQTTQSIGRYLLLLSDERCAFGVAGTTSLVAGGSAKYRTLEWFDSAPEVGFELRLVRGRGPPVLPPWHWKIGLLLSRSVHTIVQS